MGRIRLYRTEAVVLGRRDFGEADRILTLLTSDRGKLAAIAKGVRRLTSRQSGHVELFTHASMLLAEGRNLDVVTQAETLCPYERLRDDLVRTTYAYHVAETTDRFVREGEPSHEIFALVRDTLSWLTEADDPSLAARYFELRFLDLLGYRPQLTDCAACGRTLTALGNAISPDAGGALCPGCAPAARDGIALDESVFRVLRFLQERDWDVARRIALTPATRERLETIMSGLLRHHLERDLRAVTFLGRLRGTGEVGDRPPAASGAPGDAARG